MNVKYTSELWDEIKQDVKINGYRKPLGKRASKDKNRKLKDKEVPKSVFVSYEVEK